MQIKLLLVLLCLSGITACSADTSLQGVFENQMKEDGAVGFTIIHIDEGETHGLVLYTSWTHEYPDNKNKPGIRYYEKSDKQWHGRTGTGCSDRGISRLGLMGNGYLFCAIPRENRGYEKILVGDTEAGIFQVNDSISVWYAAVDNRDAKVVAILDDGTELALD